ncbi:hypothetical protein BJ165DRAFT_1522120 [Panaeolus papilionaceus]|nr:hypothetical protein BJ165DRAFT_1522120 [Panaeolus papilionaceus]
MAHQNKPSNKSNFFAPVNPPGIAPANRRLTNTSNPNRNVTPAQAPVPHTPGGKATSQQEATRNNQSPTTSPGARTVIDNCQSAKDFLKDMNLTKLADDDDVISLYELGAILFELANKMPLGSIRTATNAVAFLVNDAETRELHNETIRQVTLAISHARQKTIDEMKTELEKTKEELVDKIVEGGKEMEEKWEEKLVEVTKRNNEKEGNTFGTMEARGGTGYNTGGGKGGGQTEMGSDPRADGDGFIPPRLGRPKTNSYADAARTAGRPREKKVQLALSDEDRRTIFFDKTRGVEHDPFNGLDKTTMVEKANRALELMANEGGTVPEGVKFIDARRLRNGGVMMMVNTVEGALWVKTEGKEGIIGKMGGTVTMKEKTIKVIVDFVPVEFDPSNESTIREIEQYNGLEDRSIASANFFKKIIHRDSWQKTSVNLGETSNAL